MEDPEVERQISILKSKVRTLEGRLEASEKSIKESQSHIIQLDQKLKDVGELFIKVAEQVQRLRP